MSFSYSCSRNLGVGFVETMVELEYLSVARKYNHTVFLDTNGDNEAHDDDILCPFCPPKAVSKHLSFVNAHLYPSFQTKFQFVTCNSFIHTFFTFLCCFSFSFAVFRHVNAMNCWFNKSIRPPETVMYTHPSICSWNILLPHSECWFSLMCLVWKEYYHYWQTQFSLFWFEHKGSIWCWCIKSEINYLPIKWWGVTLTQHWNDITFRTQHWLLLSTFSFVWECLLYIIAGRLADFFLINLTVLVNSILFIETLNEMCLVSYQSVDRLLLWK